MILVDFCKELAVNLFWVLAAVIEVLMAVILILGLLSSLLGHLHHEDGEE